MGEEISKGRCIGDKERRLGKARGIIKAGGGLEMTNHFFPFYLKKSALLDDRPSSNQFFTLYLTHARDISNL